MGKTNIDMQHEMELQLHEQYAVNNNAYVSSTLAFIVGVMAVLGAFGYVYLFSSQGTAASFGELAKQDKVFTIDALVLTADAAIMVLAILFLFCLDRGAYQRKEQFITYAIRCKYFSELNGDGGEKIKIFPDRYKPFDKSWIGFVQGVFGFMLKAIAFVACVIVVLTAIKIPHLVALNMFGLILLTAYLTLLIAWLVCWVHQDQCKFVQGVIEFMLIAIAITVFFMIEQNSIKMPNQIMLNWMVIILSVAYVALLTVRFVFKPHQKRCEFAQSVLEYLFAFIAIISLIMVAFAVIKISNSVAPHIMVMILSVVCVTLAIIICVYKLNKSYEDYKELENEFTETS